MRIIKRMKEVIIKGYTTEQKHMSERVVDVEGICFTIMAMTPGYGQGYIMEYGNNQDTSQYM